MTATPNPLDVVTRAFSYSGAAITRKLHARGHRVQTLIGHPERASEKTQFGLKPPNFGTPSQLAESMGGAYTLNYTYWVRSAHDKSITNPSLDSPYPYLRAKAHVEQILTEADTSHAIVTASDPVRRRPAGEQHRLAAPARTALRYGHPRRRPCQALRRPRLRLDTMTVDTVGPQSATFREIVDAVRAGIGGRALVVRVPCPVLTRIASALSVLLRDTLLTRDEYDAMADGLADSTSPSTGTIGLIDWVAEQGAPLGQRDANELARHFRAPTALKPIGSPKPRGGPK